MRVSTGIKTHDGIELFIGDTIICKLKSELNIKEDAFCFYGSYIGRGFGDGHFDAVKLVIGKKEWYELDITAMFLKDGEYLMESDFYPAWRDIKISFGEDETPMTKEEYLGAKREDDEVYDGFLADSHLLRYLTSREDLIFEQQLQDKGQNK